MDKALLLKMKEYIELTAVQIDNEWGKCRELDELIKDGKMPELYNEIILILNKPHTREQDEKNGAFLEGKLLKGKSKKEITEFKRIFFNEIIKDH